MYSHEYNSNINSVHKTYLFLNLMVCKYIKTIIENNFIDNLHIYICDASRK